MILNCSLKKVEVLWPPLIISFGTDFTIVPSKVQVSPWYFLHNVTLLFNQASDL